MPESPTGRGYTHGSDSFPEYDLDGRREEIERRKMALAREPWHGQKLPHLDAFKMILHSAREASKVYWMSGNLALIEQICEAQLGIEHLPDASPVHGEGCA